MSPSISPVLILGAGINGCALARELLLNGVPVTLVDTADCAAGATAYSSRLIHGGLRYLEYGEFDLVRESLAERTRLLKLAPQFVRPLELFVPTDNRWGGLWSSARRFLRGDSSGTLTRRGTMLVRLGLWFYDRYARDPLLPRHRVYRSQRADLPPVNREKYRFLCSYHDAQVQFPERFTLALLEDARRLGSQQGTPLEVYLYHEARLEGRTVTLRDLRGQGDDMQLEPAAIINATGAWVDRTLTRLGVESRRLIGGTKGSHFVTSHPELRAALGDRGLYAEAADGRPVFVLPLGEATLVGTTDLPFEGDPYDAVASDKELTYLLQTVNDLLAPLRLEPSDIDLHYCGVRPLPYVSSSTPAAVTRRHWVEEQLDVQVPCFSVIGGKLTTCRSLAEETAATILARLGREVVADSRERPLPGAEDYPRDRAALSDIWQQLARRYGYSLATFRALWRLYGTATEAVLTDGLPAAADGAPPAPPASHAAAAPPALLTGSDLPPAAALWALRHEWARTLSDLVERRLMLLYEPRLCEATLRELAGLMVAEGRLAPEQVGDEVAAATSRLATHHGKRLVGAAAARSESV